MVRVVVKQEFDHLTLRLVGVKGWRKVDVGFPQLHQYLVSLHTCRERGVAHLKENDTQAVGVHFLET